eukprot:9483588-Pyramimonas_sp.AAC.1
MAKKNAWDSVAALMAHLRSALPRDYKPKVFVCYGDFRQIPAVVKYGTRAEIVQSCVRMSASWNRFRVRHLFKAHRTAQGADFTKWLESIGNGTCPTPHTWNGVQGHVPLERIAQVQSELHAIDFTFPVLNDPHRCVRAKIAATTNEEVDHFNNLVLNRLVMEHGLTEVIH